MEIKAKISDYSEAEFLELINAIKAGDDDEEAEDKLIFHFNTIVGHPAGSDLIFYPESKKAQSAEEIVETIKQHYGKSPFRQ
ncbi:MAG: bacteriocin immunity protein [Acinetobacter sp.]